MPLFDDPNDPAGGASDALLEFETALAAATTALGELEGGIGGAARGAGAPGGGGGGGGGGRRGGIGRLGRFAARLAGPAALVAAGDTFLSTAAITGSAQDGLGALNRGLISAVAKVPIFGALLGAGQAETVLGRAEQRVGGGLADLARQGIEISDDMIQQELDIVIQQERRATEVEARVRGATGAPENAASAGFGDFTKLIELVESIAGSLTNFTGGAAR